MAVQLRRQDFQPVVQCSRVFRVSHWLFGHYRRYCTAESAGQFSSRNYEPHSRLGEPSGSRSEVFAIQPRRWGGARRCIVGGGIPALGHPIV
nr:hypothetical protein CFP56_22155 [Quercus suber]